MLKLVVYTCLLSTTLASTITKLRLDGRIVGGTTAEIEDFPWQVSVELIYTNYCGGSIISENYVLTAAHCLKFESKWYTIRAGTSCRHSGGKTHDVLRVLRHPQYNPADHDYDCGIIQISGAFNLGARQAIVPLPKQDEEVAEGTLAVVTGWGHTTYGGSFSNTLRQVTVPIVSSATCNDNYGQGRITESMICAGFSEGGKDSCQGDSGGPLVAEGKLVGVVSWGSGCARPDTPGVYARVASTRLWITEITGI